MVLLREQCAEYKKAPLPHCCNLVLMKIGGQIPWNVMPICETFKIFCLMGKLHTSDVLENLSKDQSFRLVHWLSITLSLRYLCETPVENPSICEESLTWIVPWIRFVRGWNLEGWHIGCRHWGVGNDGCIRNLLEKTQCKGSNISQRKWNSHCSGRRWTNQISWRRSRTENIHLDTGTLNSRRKSKGFSWRIRRVSTYTTSWLISGCRWSGKWFLVHVRKLHLPPSRWTKSQTLLAKRRIIPYSTEIHWRLQNYSYELGCYARKPHRWPLEYRWIKKLVCFLDKFLSVSSKWETSRRIYVVREKSEKRQASSKPDHLWSELWIKFGKKCQAEREA